MDNVKQEIKLNQEYTQVFILVERQFTKYHHRFRKNLIKIFVFPIIDVICPRLITKPI
ncbi:MAG: hypothetical protein RL632_2391 [Bacteroidota bacterium]|jgi:hypothetical protein